MLVFANMTSGMAPIFDRVWTIASGLLRWRQQQVVKAGLRFTLPESPEDVDGQVFTLEDQQSNAA
jgi:hypothetical protein